MGYFAAACSGNTTSDAACVPCAPPIASHMHVPYSAQRTDYSSRVSQVCYGLCGSAVAPLWLTLWLLCGSAEAHSDAPLKQPLTPQP